MTDYYDLGAYSRTITTTSSEAQKWFDRGFLWSFGFNHEEAVQCFKKALEFDPNCAMAWWGIAHASGANYNKPWEAFDPEDLSITLVTACNAVEEAQSRRDGLTPVEDALISALPARYPSASAVDDVKPWLDDFAIAMREVHLAHPDDDDVCALFAEALMNRTPWALWDLKTGAVAEGADTAEAAEVLEAAMQRRESAAEMAHPGLLHMYIHLMEMSPHPQKALKACDALRGLVPDAGHLEHMPTHIDVLCGHYPAVLTSNQAAIDADRKFLDREGPLNFYSLYRCHNYHFKIYGAMFVGQYGPAIAAAEEMISTLPENLLRTESPPMADWLEGFVSVKQHVLIRFGKWDEIIAQDLPENQDLFCVTTAMMHYAKAVAHAASGNVLAAAAEAPLFKAAVLRVPDSRYIFNNSCLDILAIARQMMLGEIAYRREEYDEAFRHLRTSVELDDTLPFDEPWGWMQPTRHALGALLLEQGEIEEAANVYRADLGLDDTVPRACQNPDNVWSLYGYHECLIRMGRAEEAVLVKQRLDLANGRTDVPIKASCFCKQGSI
jgi:tetratricopeptide (TPR) repeat protein